MLSICCRGTGTVKAALLTFTYTRILQTALVFTVSRGTHADLSKKAVEKKNNSALSYKLSLPAGRQARFASVHMMIRSHHQNRSANKRLFRLPVSSCVATPQLKSQPWFQMQVAWFQHDPGNTLQATRPQCYKAFVGTDAAVEVNLRCNLLLQGGGLLEAGGRHLQQQMQFCQLLNTAWTHCSRHCKPC